MAKFAIFLTRIDEFHSQLFLISEKVDIGLLTSETRLLQNYSIIHVAKEKLTTEFFIQFYQNSGQKSSQLRPKYNQYWKYLLSFSFIWDFKVMLSY